MNYTDKKFQGKILSMINNESDKTVVNDLNKLLWTIGGIKHIEVLLKEINSYSKTAKSSKILIYIVSRMLEMKNTFASYKETLEEANKAAIEAYMNVINSKLEAEKTKADNYIKNYNIQ